jgi:threonine/homoserine efflux transporter RhtA
MARGEERSGTATTSSCGRTSYGRSAIMAWLSWIRSAISRCAGTFQLPTISVLSQLLVAACFYPLIPYALKMKALKTMFHYQFGILMSAEPLVAVVIGWTMLGQGISRWQIVGLAMITFSNALSASRRGVSESVPETTR